MDDTATLPDGARSAGSDAAATGARPHDRHVEVDRAVIAAPHRELLDQVLDKWSLQVLDELCDRTLRFNELRRAIPAVTQKSLTATLRRLERNGMVERVVTGTRPLAVEYRIAPLGKSLQGLIDALLAWTTETMPGVERARAAYDAAT